MLLRLAYLAVTNTFSFMRPLPMADRDKEIEFEVRTLTGAPLYVFAVIEHACAVPKR